MSHVRASRPGGDIAGRWDARTVAAAGQLACVLEASAEKPGNVRPSHGFADTSYETMLAQRHRAGPRARARRRAGRL